MLTRRGHAVCSADGKLAIRSFGQPPRPQIGFSAWIVSPQNDLRPYGFHPHSRVQTLGWLRHRGRGVFPHFRSCGRYCLGPESPARWARNRQPDGRDSSLQSLPRQLGARLPVHLARAGGTTQHHGQRFRPWHSCRPLCHSSPTEWRTPEAEGSRIRASAMGARLWNPTSQIDLYQVHTSLA